MQYLYTKLSFYIIKKKKKFVVHFPENVLVAMSCTVDEKEKEVQASQPVACTYLLFESGKFYVCEIFT